MALKRYKSVQWRFDLLLFISAFRFDFFHSISPFFGAFFIGLLWNCKIQFECVSKFIFRLTSAKRAKKVYEILNRRIHSIIAGKNQFHSRKCVYQPTEISNGLPSVWKNRRINYLTVLLFTIRNYRNPTERQRPKKIESKTSCEIKMGKIVFVSTGK